MVACARVMVMMERQRFQKYLGDKPNLIIDFKWSEEERDVKDDS